MNPNTMIGYISSLDTACKKDPKFDESSLDILEHFVWKKCVSAYQIFSDLRSTTVLKMAYKNVNKRVNALLSASLIQEAEIVENNKHNAKYYKLTEYGIYRLFLHRVNSLLVNQSDLRNRRLSLQYIPINALTFFRNYSYSMLFEVFIYPYFRKESLFAVGDRLLIELYRYLASCCKGIEKYLKSKSIDIQFSDAIFSWNNVPGKDNGKLLAYLKQILNLESIEQANIKKEEDTDELSKMTVNISDAAPILIILDKARMKIEIISTVDNVLKKLESDVRMLDQEMTVGNRISNDESIKALIIDSKQKIEQLIYGFVYSLASSSSEDPEVSYYVQILSGDNSFITVLQEVYENRHKGFERGYRLLTNHK
jgi:hypothetical protein